MSTQQPSPVTVRVGVNGVHLKGQGWTELWPVVETEWPVGTALEVPKQLAIRWQDQERTFKEGPKKKYIALYEPQRGKNAPPWVVYRVSNEDREKFERLFKMWQAWYLRFSIQGVPGQSDFRIEPPGYYFDKDELPASSLAYVLQETDLLKDGIPEGSNKLNREKYIAKLCSHIRSQPTAAPIDDENLLLAATRIADNLESLGGPLPWTISEPRPASYYKIERDDHEEIVANFIQVSAAFSQKHARYEVKNAPTTPEFQNHVEAMATIIRRSKIFELSYETFTNVYQAADVFTTETVAELKYTLDKPVSDEERADHQRKVVAEGANVPFPEALPFDVCWFAVGRGRMGLTGPQKMAREIDPSKRRRLVAIVVAETGFAAEVFAEDDVRTGNVAFKLLVHRLPDNISATGWIHPYSLIPWIILYLVEAVNDHRTTILEGEHNFTEKRLYEKLSKKLRLNRPMPAPFYTVLMREKIIRSTANRLNRRMGISFAYSHRFDRRAHTAARIMRGNLPMPTETLEMLQKRGGYKIFSTDEVDDDTRVELMRRHIPSKAPNEWLAVKIWERPHTVVGDESLPYVPSNRKGTKGVLGYRDTAASKADAESPAQPTVEKNESTG